MQTPQRGRSGGAGAASQALPIRPTRLVLGKAHERSTLPAERGGRKEFRLALILTTPPTAEPVSLAEAKAHLRLSHNDDDTYLASLTMAARRMIESRLSLAIMPQAWALFADRWPDDGIVQLPLHPVTSIESVAVFGDDDSAATIDPAHFYLDAASRPARLVLRHGRFFNPPGRKANGIRISFEAGYEVAPAELKQALLITIADWFSRRGDDDGGTLPPAALELMQPFRLARL